MKVTFASSREQFHSSTLYNPPGAGRGALVLKAVQSVVTAPFSEILKSCPTDIMQAMIPSEREYCNSIWCFGYAPTMQSTGMEFCNVGPLKVQYAGMRRVIACCFHELATFAKTTQDATYVWSVFAIGNVLSEVDEWN